LWIGARTTVNPFSVQDVADALKGADVPVLIKNPINPDLELWIGAVERVANSGIKNIGLIHRGFSSYGNTEYRNAPMWIRPIFLIPELATRSTAPIHNSKSGLMGFLISTGTSAPLSASATSCTLNGLTVVLAPIHKTSTPK